MKIFMSWSGPRSHAAAEVISWWAKCVIQASRPWISSLDVDRGTLWFSEITNVLADTSVGIVCLTHENKNRPWILFEVGALAKGLSTSRVCTFLCDLDPRDIQDPLAQFNHTKPDQDGMKKLARTLNGVLGVNGLDPNVLNDACDTYWPQFSLKYDAAMNAHPLAGPVEVRSKEDVLEEILDSVRGMNQRVRQLETAGVPTWDTPYSLTPNDNHIEAVLQSHILSEVNRGKSFEEILKDSFSHSGYTDKAKKMIYEFIEQLETNEKTKLKNNNGGGRPRNKSSGSGV